ncbi:ATP-binding cassette domain-containing protein [Marinobacter halodurans]|uniref:ATP-binding cassette domain-containing protein n=1 Tax=Marinobacter halodurans TaxID=2528979 RepID=A0ABY1ZI40_9GAMM|nr:ATP-binding cassette domain-containing protein [Marinobacter halodurans]TBW48232.1 ATP-binding cassette domain-containing protein [Marinobacter halodurans]
MEETPGSLALENVAVGALNAVSFSVAPGEVVCLSGPSGVGKSRLLRAVADIEAHQGAIRLAGEAQSSMPAHQWRRRVVMVPADSQWWFDTVAGHFDGDLPEDDLAALGFGPEVAGWSVSRLSTGERQRLALLRAMVLEPGVLLLDEPTSNLDAERARATERWLLDRIEARRMAVLWVAHDAEQIARVARRHVRLVDHGMEVVRECD